MYTTGELAGDLYWTVPPISIFNTIHNLKNILLSRYLSLTSVTGSLSPFVSRGTITHPQAPIICQL